MMGTPFTGIMGRHPPRDFSGSQLDVVTHEKVEIAVSVVSRRYSQRPADFFLMEPVS